VIRQRGLPATLTNIKWVKFTGVASDPRCSGTGVSGNPCILCVTLFTRTNKNKKYASYESAHALYRLPKNLCKFIGGYRTNSPLASLEGRCKMTNWKQYEDSQQTMPCEDANPSQQKDLSNHTSLERFMIPAIHSYRFGSFVSSTHNFYNRRSPR
jgi:hypothetical protein